MVPFRELRHHSQFAGSAPAALWSSDEISRAFDDILTGS